MDDTVTRAQIAPNPHITSDRIEGTAVCAKSGDPIGTIKRLVIEKRSGLVVFAVTRFADTPLSGRSEYSIPWGRLTYDKAIEAYRADMTVEQLRNAPCDDERLSSAAIRERELYHYYGIQYFEDQARDGISGRG